MKSKTSFFNKTIFKKNMTLFSPLWAGYLVFLAIMVPGRLWKNFRKIMLHPEWYSQDALDRTDSFYRSLGDILGTDMQLFGVVIMAALTIMGIYHYLCVSKNANMIHSLPVTRTELYLTNVVSGLMVCWGPQIIVTVLSEIICIRYGYHYEKELFLWLLYGMGTTVIFQSIATLCAMLTGLWIAMPIYYGIANGLVLGITSLISFIISGFAYGVNYSNGWIWEDFVRWMTPMFNIPASCSFSLVKDATDTMVTGISFGGGKVLCVYFVAAIGLYALGLIAYKKRALECAGELVAFSFLKPILRWGVGFGGGYLCAIFVEAILLEIGDRCSPVTLLLLDLLFAVVFYFLMEMFIQKRVKIWKSGWTKQLIAFLLFMVISYGGMYGIGAYVEKKVPEISEIERAYIEQNRCVEYTGEDIAEVIELQKELVERKEYSGYNMNGWVTITYLMKDGRSIERYYTYPIREEYRSIIEKIDEKANLPENVALDVLCYNYKEQLTPKSVKFEGFMEYYGKVNVEARDIKPENWPDGFESAEDAKRIYEAFLKDIEEGNYGKDDQYQYDYETGTMFAEEEYDGKGFWMYMDFDVADLDHYQSMQMRKQNEIYYRGEGSYAYSDRNVIEFSDLKNRARVQKEFYITQNCANVIEAIEELSVK